MRFLAFALLFFAGAVAQQLREIVLFPTGAPNETSGFPGPEKRVGDDGHGCGTNRDKPCDHVYNVSIPTLTPFVVSNGTGGAVIIAPGGGYSDLSFSKEGEDVAHVYNQMGVSAFVLKYRVPARPSLPFGFAPLQDAQRAIRIVRHSASKWGLNSSRIGFVGFSAGGHLTAYISTAWHENVYGHIDEADNVSSRPDFSIFMYPWKLLKNNNKTTSDLAPELDHVEWNHPPSFMCQTADDTAAWVQNTLQYSLKLIAVGAPKPTTHIYRKGGHGFGLCQTMLQFEEVCDWTQAAKRFLQDLEIAPGFPSSHNARPCEDASQSALSV